MARWLRMLRLGGAACAIAVGLVASGGACSSSDKPGVGSSSGALPPPPQVTPPPSAIDAGDDASSGAPLGDLPTIDEPNVPCTMTTATPVPLFGPGDSGLGG